MHAKMVVDFTRHSETQQLVMRFHVDPRYPNRWREEPYYSQIKRMALQGLRGDWGAQIFMVISLKADFAVGQVVEIVAKRTATAFQDFFGSLKRYA